MCKTWKRSTVSIPVHICAIMFSNPVTSYSSLNGISTCLIVKNKNNKLKFHHQKYLLNKIEYRKCRCWWYQPLKLFIINCFQTILFIIKTSDYINKTITDHTTWIIWMYTWPKYLQGGKMISGVDMDKTRIKLILT